MRVARGRGCDGWWPPGPSCPADQTNVADVFFPASPTVATETCFTRTGDIGVMTNGVSIYNWSDDRSYNDAGVWFNLAVAFEVNDLDICLGHATQSGDYHQHLNANCLADQLGDTGTGHSQVYGFAADGYPIHGLYYASAQEALSSWVARDYTLADEITCASGSGQSRGCLLIDNLSAPATANLTAAGSVGPDTNTTEQSQSGNTIAVTSGAYYEDFYNNSSLTSSGSQYLDEHNGHDHDAFGYHYHITSSFPFNIGPSYYGTLESDAMLTCAATPYNPS